MHLRGGLLAITENSKIRKYFFSAYFLFAYSHQGLVEVGKHIPCSGMQYICTYTVDKISKTSGNA